MNKSAIMMAFVLAMMPVVVKANGVVIHPNGSVSTVITTPAINHDNQRELSKEEIMLHRIAILEKAKNSQDPDVLMMAKQVRATIAKEQELEQLKQENWLKYLFVAEKKMVFLTLCLIILFIPIGLLIWGVVYDWIKETKKAKNKSNLINQSE